MSGSLVLAGRPIGEGYPVFVVAELSANHHQSFDVAVRLVEAAADAGADAVKLQTYTPDTLTIDCSREEFRIASGTIWDGQTLYRLYAQAYTPWEWQPKLMKLANDVGLVLFSTPFDDTAVEFLEEMNAPAYKVASFELVDLPLIRRLARTGKPIILSTGMATVEEIDEALGAARKAGAEQLALLKCTSAYPARPEDMNLQTIPFLSSRFAVPIGLSDHTLGIATPVAAVALGACIVEKHLTLSRSTPGPDSSFSLEPGEFRAMVEAVREVEKVLGTAQLGPTADEQPSRLFRRSLFVVADVRAGERFTADNVRSIRPGHGLHPRDLERVLGCRASRDIPRGTPLSWNLVLKEPKV